MSYDVRKLKGILTVAVAVAVIALAAALIVLIFCRAESFEIIGSSLYEDDELIVASEIEKGEFLYSIDRDGAVRAILKKCTLISDVRIKVKLPNRVIISVTEDSPMFYANVGVSTVMFSHDLRIAEVRQNSGVGSGVRVLMPEIASAVAGERILFKNGEPTYVAKLLEEAVKSELFSRITLIDCVSTREAYYEIDGKYKLVLGGVSDLDVKLRVAAEYLENPRIANASSAVLDLTSPKEVIVTVNE